MLVECETDADVESDADCDSLVEESEPLESDLLLLLSAEESQLVDVDASEVDSEPLSDGALPESLLPDESLD